MNDTIFDGILVKDSFGIFSSCTNKAFSFRLGDFFNLKYRTYFGTNNLVNKAVMVIQLENDYGDY